VETIPRHIFRKDTEGHFTFANQQLCKSLGKKLEEIVGKTDFDFFPAELAAKYRHDDSRVMETGQPLHAVEEHKDPGQETIYVEVIKTPLHDANGKIIGLQGVFWDITQQRLAEERIRRANALLAQSRKVLRAKNRQMEDDLRMAREIQLTMLPQQYPSLPGGAAPADSAFKFAHRYLPTSAVGGDFFTVSALADERASVFICDVAGHGVRSALVTAMIRALLEELKSLAGEPGHFLTQLNRDLYAILRHAGTPLLTTAFYLVADWTTGLMSYTNAGHPRPLHLRRHAGKVGSLLNSGGKSQPALGLMPEATYQTSEVALAPGDLIMMFTDGLYEVQDAEHALYSQAMLISGVQQRLHLPAPQLFDELLEEIQHFSADGKFADDVCLVGMELSETRPA
jgi:sigma-B regulation protein RsbU (phosphoserine phosphatase)